MRHAFLHLDLSTRLVLFIATQFFVYCWTRYVVAPAKVGRQRMLRAVPVLAVLYLASLLFHPKRIEEYAMTLSTASAGLWIGSSKVIAFCVNRGQLMKSYEAGSNYAFGVGLLFPVVVAFEEIPTAKGKDHEGKGKGESRVHEDVQFKTVLLSRKQYYTELAQIILQIVSKTVLLNVLDYGLQYLSETEHSFWRDCCLALFICHLSSLGQDIVSLASLVLFNLKLKPNFDNPFLSQSLSELWSHRYNPVYGEALRDTVYNPLCEGRLIPGSKYFKEHPSESWKAIAQFTTFCMSGLFHALSGMQAFDIGFPLLYGLFFVANGVIVILESLVKNLLKDAGTYEKISSSIPSIVYVVYVNCVFFYLMHTLFLPDLISDGIDERMVQSSFAKVYIGG